MLLYLIVFNILTSILGLLGCVRQFQMLQQNSYFFVRYFRWYKSNFNFKEVTAVFIAVIGAILASSVISPDTAYYKFTLTVLLLYLLKNAVSSVLANKTSVKTLVLTARVKRMFAAASALTIVLIVLGAVLKSAVFSGVLFFLAAFPQVLTMLTLGIMTPIEKSIAKYYVNDAKKILKSKKDLKIIGVTGSYGKTSTKVILGRILSEKYNTLVTPENYNTPMGLVITVRKHLKPQTEIFVAEMGAKRKGDIKEDCDIANPTMGIITSVGPQHLDTFGNIETVISTKFELADRVKENGGKVFLNFDNELIKNNSDGYDFISYGTSDADVKVQNITYSADGLTLQIAHGNGNFKVTSKLLGHHNALNIAAASAVALELGLTEQEIAFAVSKIKPIEHRLEMKPYISGSTLIDDAYNSNPEGCLEAVRVLGRFNGMKKIIVTPGLVELGDKEYECNKALGKLAAEICDEIILVGRNRWQPLKDGIEETGFNSDKLHLVTSFKEAVSVFSPMCDKNTVILFENDLPDNYLN